MAFFVCGSWVQKCCTHCLPTLLTKDLPFLYSGTLQPPGEPLAHDCPHGHEEEAPGLCRVPGHDLCCGRQGWHHGAQQCWEVQPTHQPVVSRGGHDVPAERSEWGLVGLSMPHITMWGEHRVECQSACRESTGQGVIVSLVRRPQGRVSVFLWGEHRVKCQSSYEALLLSLHLHLFSVREKVCKNSLARWRDSQAMPQTPV